MKTSLIIHGHFYQPPRENPFTGLVPDQESAGSFKNWNEAVYRTCYRPNAYSRYLSSDGKIKKIYNNYCSISFNMGPSLLKWTKESHTYFINKLLEADRESLQKFGHSNIIAQAYSHTILPLDSPLIRKLDIHWAIQDYKNNFGHDPEGFWCPECAINAQVIDDLVNEGIKFVILSPWQALKIGNTYLNGKSAPCDRPFLVKGINKTISVFFYDPDYASGISFGHMLRDADALYSKLIQDKKKRNNPSLIHWATDGEIYGHHEAFGDMALAALIEKINNGSEFELTNYASYLEKHPATETAELYFGEDGKGSSWSCCHGVGRWERDCGCHTGGEENWNQSWRSPMRNAFNNLEHKVLNTVLEEFKILKDKKPEDLLCDYGDVLCGKTAPEDFLSSLTKDESVRKKLAILFDITRNTVNMYTSCGWFFNDICGIEPVQNMTYALYVAQGLSKLTNNDETADLLSDLSKAKSNIPSKGNGKKLLKEEISKLPASVLISAVFVLNRYFAKEKDFQNSFGFFKLIEISSSHVRIKKATTFETFEYDFKIKENEKHKIEINLSDGENKYFVTTAKASKRVLRIISSWIENKLGECIKPETFKELLKSMNEYILITSDNTSAINKAVFFGNIGLCVRALQSQIMNDQNTSWEERKAGLRQICKITKNWGSDGLQELLKLQFENQLKYMARLIASNGLTDNHANIILDVLNVARTEGIIPDITLLQDVMYKFLTGEYPSCLKKSSLKRLSEDLNFS